MVKRITEIFAEVPEVPRPETRNEPTTIAALSDGLEPRLVDWALGVAARAAAEVYQDVAPTRYEAMTLVIGRSIEAISINLVRYLLVGHDSPSAVRVSQAQRQTALDSVRLDIALDRIISGLRALDHHWRRAFIELVLERMPREDAVELLSSIDRSLAIYFGALIDQNTRIYLAERQRLQEERATGQRQLLDRVAAGQHVEESALADAFGARPGDWWGFLVSRASDEQHGGSAIDFAAIQRVVAQRFRDHVLTTIPADGASIWIVLSGPRLTAGEMAMRLEAIIDAVPDAITSVGLPGQGVAGLRRAQRTARATGFIHERAKGVGPVIGFAEHGLLALLGQQPDLARWFVEQELGPLLSDPGAEDLQRTLLVLISHSGSLARTAQELYVHRNTVAYRLKRIEEILGRDPLARPAETYAALLLAEHLA